MSDSYNVTKIKAALIDAARSNGTDGILDQVTRYFQCPILLVDKCFMLLHSRPGRPVGDAEWDAVISSGCINQEDIWRILDDNLSGKKPFYDPFYVSDGLFHHEPMILGELIKDNEVSGHLIVCIGNRAVPEGALEVISVALYLIAQHMENTYHGMEQWHKTMAAQLQLLLTETPPHLRKSAIEQLERDLTGDYAIMVTPFGQTPSQRAFADYAVLQLQKTYRGIVTMTLGRYVVTLCGGIAFHPLEPVLRPENNELIAGLFRYFENYTLKPGLSSRFEKLDDIRIYYKQALLSAKLANSINPEIPAVFTDLMPLPLIAAALESEPEQIFIHPVFPRIREYDRLHNTEYELTLRTYELCMQNRDEAAARLNIHKNTMKYRLERIHDLFNIDTADSQTAVNLLCSSLVLELSVSSDENPGSAMPFSFSGRLPGSGSGEIT